MTTPDYQKAFAIMGGNFFGIEEAVRYLGIKPTLAQTRDLAQIPFSETLLEECKNTHILIVVFPISMRDMAKVAPSLFSQEEPLWFQDKPRRSRFSWLLGKFIRSKFSFWSTSCDLGWQLVRKAPVPRSDGEYSLEEDEDVPSIQTMVYTILSHFLSTGECLFGDDQYALTCTRVLLKNPFSPSYVAVRFVDGRIGAFRWWWSFLNGFGISSAKNPLVISQSVGSLVS